MDYFILYNGESIGTMANPWADQSMGMVYGPFQPLAAYEQVRSVFRLFTEASDDASFERYYRERDALNLKVSTQAGLHVPAAWVHIYDLAQEVGDETGYAAEFNVGDYRFYLDRRYWDGFTDTVEQNHSS